MPSDTSLERKRRGRQRKVNYGLCLGTANVYQAQFNQAWPILGKRLLRARTPAEVWSVLKSGDGIISNADVFTFAERVFQIVQHPKFPQLRANSQIRFLADSLGAGGLVTPRRSREICAKERAKVRHVLVRRDFYVECTCGYAGPALYGACQKCGTLEISDELRRREEYGY